VKKPRKKFRKQGVGRISTGLHHPAGQEPENDVWRRLERAFVAGKLRPGQSIRVGELRSMAKAGAQCMLSLQLRLAEQRSLLLLVEEEEGYRVEARYGEREGEGGTGRGGETRFWRDRAWRHDL
jgi:hypothetical protein